MNESSGKRPYEEVPGTFDYFLRPDLTNGWQYPQELRSDGKYKPMPKGPGEFVLHSLVERKIKTIEVKYRFYAGTEAEIQAAEEGAPIYKISAPEGYVIIPVGAVHKWILRLPAGTQVHAHIDKLQLDLEAMRRRRQNKPVSTPEQIEAWQKMWSDWRESRKRDGK